MNLKELWKQNKIGFLVSGIIISIGAFIIHAKYNQPIDLSAFFMWLPAVWIFFLLFTILIGFIIGGNE